ncbi:MAG: hypothetical protein A3I74_02550 [Candidatus Magasanikbacteria bacterium RIFCSPLOWO2_02_FULL_47_16]|nr:MAG: hypothetical protein A3I74_02550 [Candidatus Magasanikbacteria bacterium RIFCSPLOWO2_02_FULL_47_16]
MKILHFFRPKPTKSAPFLRPGRMNDHIMMRRKSQGRPVGNISTPFLAKFFGFVYTIPVQ